jgi:putative transposase
VPLSATICSANKHDKTQVVNVLEAVMLARPECEQHICLDKGYDYPDVHEELTSRGYNVHIPSRGLDTPIPPKDDPDRHPARRWVVERCHAWLHKFRKILVRYERLPHNYLALVHFACSLILYRKILT